MDRSAFIKTLKEVMKKLWPLHLIMNLLQSFLKSLWNYIWDLFLNKDKLEFKEEK